MTSVRCSEAARDAPRLTAVVVLPTPPFWLAIAITRAKLSPDEERMYQSSFDLSKMFHMEHKGEPTVPRGTVRQVVLESVTAEIQRVELFALSRESKSG
jgi:hypothetical protein